MAVGMQVLAGPHLEQISRSFSALTIGPYTNAVNYFFPFISAFFANYHELRVDPAQEAMMPEATAARMLKEITDLTNCAGIQRKVVPYVALYHQFSSCGGSFSLTKPALLLPDQHMFRRDGLSPFGQEKPEENLRENLWVFSDDETRFLIARELGQIRENSGLVRMAIKVAVIIALVTIYASPFGWPMGLSLFIGVLGMYIVTERLFQGRADVVGVEILRKMKPNAVQIAIDALEKMRRQNLYYREHSWAAKWYITKNSNNRLNFIEPSLTSRIETLRRMT